MTRTGYTEPVVDYALDALFGELDEPTLLATIENELGTLDALDGFVARGGRPDIRFVPNDPVAVVSSSTTIGVAIPAFAYALCAKASVRVKDRSDTFVAAFAETVASEQPDLARRIQISQWSSSDTQGAAEALRGARVVVAYGSDATLAKMRATLGPGAHFIPFGHRTSVGYVAREALASSESAANAARGAAVDGLLYDGEGCLSIHALFVERGGAIEPGTFAKLVADACDGAAVEFPAGYAELDASAVAIRAAALFRAAQGAGAVYGGTLAPHLVVFDPPQNEPPPWARRTLVVYPVDGPDDALIFLERHAIAIEAVATAEGPPRPDVQSFAVTCGASWFARLGTLQRPPLGGEHGGVGRILPFVRAIYRSC